MQRDFTNIFVLVTFILAIILGGGYFGISKYQKFQEEKLKKEVLQQEKENKLQETLTLQQKALDETTSEIEKLKKQREESQKKQEALETKLISQSKVNSKEYTISAEDVAPYLTGVVRIECDGESGSGSLWNFPDLGNVVLTNKHVVKKPYPYGNCLVYVDSTDRSKKTNDFYLIGAYQVFPSYNKSSYRINYNVDIKALEIKQLISREDAPNFLSIDNLNYRISSVPKCKTEMSLGSPVVIIGYPAFTKRDTINPLGYVQDEKSRTITNGIISAYDSTVTGEYGTLPYSNYFISAKIDSGNSGGIALSKDKNGLCVLGVPTWLNVGNYDTQGVVQNIHNLVY